MTPLTVGVDPGLTGAIACVQGEHLRWVIDTPVADGRIAVPLLNRLYDDDEYGPWPIDPGTHIAVEKVGSMPGQGVASTFKFGQAYGTVLGFFGAHHRIHHPTPTEWKKTFRLTGKDKDAARLKAIELWPAQAAEFFSRKKDVGRADAALIALHAARQTI